MNHLLYFDEPIVIPPEDMDSPAAIVNQHWACKTLPIGNGKLGATAYGSPDHEQFQFNADSLWVGNEDNTGAYQPLANIHIEMPHGSYSNYRRELDIEKALQTITYDVHGVTYRREYFASYPAQLLVLRLTADKPAALSGRMYLTNEHGIPGTAKGRELVMQGKSKQLWYWNFLLENPDRLKANREFASDKIIDLDFEARIRVLNSGGEVHAREDTLTFDGCDSLTIFVAADTNYINRRDLGWRTDHPHDKLVAQLDAAEDRRFADLLDEHIADYQSIFGRLDLNLGNTDEKIAVLPTPRRLEAYRTQGEHGHRPDDRELETLMYQYARYLMISSSRPGEGGLPANLQGVWLVNKRPPWRCDFHTDINIQMNYWFVDQANIGECFVPFYEWIDSIREVRKDETRKVLGVKRGWLMRSENGIFGGSTWHIQKGDSAWLCQNLWDHYVFTRDSQYLADVAYPIMKEISEFWLDHLKQLPDGTLVAPGGRSPEHGPVGVDGVSYDQQLCWDLFNNTIEACEVLGVDEAFCSELTDKRDRLLGPQVGRWGQLQEWMEDIDDPECAHRHTSHLIAVYPGRQITLSETPEAAEAAKVGLIARGASDPAWGKVWRACLFARLGEPEHAYQRLSNVIKTRTHGNLWTIHPPFQIDGNFGYAAAVNEMLAQSHTDTIDLLPALPKAWPTGHVRGMRLRGGYELDMTWREGKLAAAQLRGVTNDGQPCQVRYGGNTATVTIKPGEAVDLDIA